MSNHAQQIGHQIEQTASHFRFLTRRYALFHTIFFSLFVCELIALLLFLPFLSKNFLLAMLVAATVLTAFSYFVVRFYLQTKKPEQFLFLRDEFVQNCQHLFASSTELSASREGFLKAIYQLIHCLEGQEYQYYQIPSSLETLQPLVQKFSVWCHWSDVQLMKELLHTYSIRTQLEWVKAHPTDSILHVSLANSYIALSKIYQDPTKNGKATYPFIAKEYSTLENVQKFQKSAQCALEELKIILHYQPHDTEALTHLASVYNNLGQKEEERKIYELLLQLAPEERTVRYRLGILYFQLGFMASGLKIYNDFKKLSDPKAEELILHYDAFHSLH